MFPLFLLIATLVPTGHVSDFAHLLQPETISSLETSLSSLEKETGAEIAVVTIDSRGTDETIESYAEKLFQQWGIGKAKEDNGLLLLIARDDREMRIEVGYGLEPIITDIESSRIIREILTPAFQSEQYDAGVLSAVERIAKGVKNGAPLDPLPTSTQIPWGDMVPVAMFFLIFLASVLARSKSWWAGGILGGIFGWIVFGGIIWILGVAVVGLLFDYVVSKAYKNSVANGVTPPWWIGGGGHGGMGGGGLGGFGGGMSGGGGASGRW